MLYFILSFFVMMAPVKCWSATLNQALTNTYNTNPEFKDKQEAIKAEHEKIVQALAGWRPTVDMSANMTLGKQINSGNSKDQPNLNTPSGKKNNTHEGSINIRQNLYTGGGTLAQTSLAENSIRAGWANLQATEQTVLLSAIQSYLELLSKYKQVELYKANKAALLKNLEDAQEKKRVGEETITQLANAQARFADADAQLQNNEAQLEGAKATFERITGLKAPTKMEKPVAFQHSWQTLEEVLRTASEENPSVIASQFDHLTAQAEADRITSGLLPTIDLVGSASRQESRTNLSYTGITNQSSNDYVTNHQIAIQAKVPLYEAGSIRSQRRQALETASQKRMAIETVRRQTMEQAIQIWQNYLAAKNNIQNYQKQVEAAQISLEGTTQEMNVGSKVLLDVLNAQRDLLQAQLALVEAEKTYFYESYRLLAIIGRLNAKTLKLEVDYFDPQTHYQNIRGNF